MKNKILAIIAFIFLIGIFSSCTEEEVKPVKIDNKVVATEGASAEDATVGF